ncbi:MAG TPA: hypothetical protein VFY76_06395 [Nocardioides sp.]|nr:hypothetical protein [Nocardioides sp.]
MSRPDDESRTELAWREIVENYGERPTLDDPSASPDEPAPTAASAAGSSPGAPPTELPEGLPEDLVDDDEVEKRERAIAESESFRPPPAPPFPAPRTWQRGLAWAGIFVAPVIALVIGLLSIYVHPLVGWLLVGWFVGGFAYLVLVMPKAPRDPWDDGSRI